VDWFNQYNTLPTAQNPSGKAAFVGSLELARTWSDYYGRPVHMGEFGAYELADATSRANFYRDMRETLDRLGIGWAVWDWKAGFKYWNGPLNQPAPGMPGALFPKTSVRSGVPGHLQMDSAVGKRHRVFRSGDLAAPVVSWQLLIDAPLTTPTLEFTDPAPPADRAFYLVEWVK
jgi:hypothetical protein